MDTVSFPRIDSGGADSPKNICFPSHNLKVFRVDAETHPTEMVKFIAARDSTTQNLPNPTVYDVPPSVRTN